jgi:type I restriction enzyme, S subunit
MIDGLRPYPEMKPSDLPWLGAMPAHWDVRRNGRLFGARRETGFPDLPVLEVSIRSGVRIRDFDNGGRKQEMADRSKYQRAVRGDIAYNMMRMWQGAVGIAPADGLISPAYVVARPFPESDAAYYAYLFRTAAYMREIDVFSRGIVPDRNRLYWESFKQMPSVYPPLDEQRLIVRFLDWHGAQTAKLVHAKKEVIALLNEQKQAIIHCAVTRGLDPNVKLKPSGIPWLGDVPEGWGVKRLRNVAELRVSNIDKKSFDDERSVRLCNYVDVYKNDVIHAGIPFMKATASETEIERFRLRIDDVIITKDSEDWKDIGVPALVATEADDLVCAYHLALLRPIASEANGAFVFWQLLSPDVRWQFAIAANGVTRYGLSHGSVKELVLAIPDLEEQRAIAAHLDTATANIRSSEQGIQREIALIQEFRTRLIADVVTGRLDVRALAPRLPDIIEPGAADETSDDEDLDEAIDAPEDEEVAA